MDHQSEDNSELPKTEEENQAFTIGEMPSMDELVEAGMIPEGYEPPALPGLPSLPEDSLAPDGATLPGALSDLPAAEFDEGGVAPLPEEHLPTDFPPSPSDISENTGNTGLSLESLLDHEVAQSDFATMPPADLALLASDDQMSSFQLKVFLQNDEQRQFLQKSLKELELDFSPQNQKVSAPLLSRLSELQATLLYQLLSRAGIRVDFTQPILPPEISDPQSDILGSNLEFQGETLTVGSPAVPLVANAKEVLLFTLKDLPGFQISETRGVISSHRSIAKRLFREQDMQRKIDQELSAYRSKQNLKSVNVGQVEKTFAEIFFELQKNALAVGANAVLDIRIETFSENLPLEIDTEQVRLVALGSAAVVEKNKN